MADQAGLRLAENPFLESIDGAGVEEPVADWIDLSGPLRLLTEVQTLIGTGEDLARTGRFIIVSGEDHAGKTTLIRQCAATVRAAVRASTWRTRPVRPQVVMADLREAGVWEAGVEEQRRVVYDLLWQHLDSQFSLTDTELDRLTAVDRVDVGYQRISHLLNERARRQTANVVLIVLLPKFRFGTQEVLDYARLAVSPRLLIFGETSFDPGRDDWARKVESVRHVKHLHLERIGLDDAVLFLQVGQARFITRPSVPIVSRDTMNEILSPRLKTIGALRKFLGLIVDDKAVPGVPLGEVTMSEIQEIHFRKNPPGGL